MKTIHSLHIGEVQEIIRGHLSKNKGLDIHMSQVEFDWDSLHGVTVIVTDKEDLFKTEGGRKRFFDVDDDDNINKDPM